MIFHQFDPEFGAKLIIRSPSIRASHACQSHRLWDRLLCSSARLYLLLDRLWTDLEQLGSAPHHRELLILLHGLLQEEAMVLAAAHLSEPARATSTLAIDGLMEGRVS